MTFSKPSFLKKEQTQWGVADLNGKKELRQLWSQQMLKEASKHCSLSTQHSVNLTLKKMKTVKAARAFDWKHDEDLTSRPVHPSTDASAVVKWANDNASKAEALQSSEETGYLSSKFRLFRSLHFWMETTVRKIWEYEEAKEASKMCGYWDCDESGRFSFDDFVGSESKFTKESFQAQLQALHDLSEIDRNLRSDCSEQDNTSVESDQEDE